MPKLQAAGWDDSPHAINEQRTFTDGRVIFIGGKAKRGKQKRADYILRYRPDFPIAVVEAKARHKSADDGLQQAKDYAETLGLKFAYAANGTEIIEVDYLSGIERGILTFPTPNELWQRLRKIDLFKDDTVAEQLLAPTYPDRPKPLRTRRERADRLKKENAEFLSKYGTDARSVLESILEKYAEHGEAEFKLPGALEVPPVSDFGNVIEIPQRFGEADKLRDAIAELTNHLYAA